MLTTTNDVLIFLCIFLGALLAIAVMVLLIYALTNLIKTIRKVNKLLDDNTENITKTVKKLPDLADNIEKVVASTGETIDGLKGTFLEPKDSDDTILRIISITESVAGLIANMFSKKKK